MGDGLQIPQLARLSYSLPREWRVSQHRVDPIKGPSETHQRSHEYGTEGVRRGPQFGCQCKVFQAVIAAVTPLPSLNILLIRKFRRLNVS